MQRAAQRAPNPLGDLLARGRRRAFRGTAVGVALDLDHQALAAARGQFDFPSDLDGCLGRALGAAAAEQAAGQVDGVAQLTRPAGDRARGADRRRREHVERTAGRTCGAPRNRAGGCAGCAG